MDSLEITGGAPLCGEITISGAKNAALPLLALGLMTDARLILKNVPALADTVLMEQLLRHHGICLDRTDETVSMTGPADVLTRRMILSA